MPGRTSGEVMPTSSGSDAASQEVTPGRTSGEVRLAARGSDAGAYAPGRKARFAGMKNQLRQKIRRNAGKDRAGTQCTEKHRRSIKK